MLGRLVGDSMCMSDPISDMITRIRNALSVGKSSIVVPYSRIKLESLSLLLREGYLKSVDVSGEGSAKVIMVGLKYYSGSKVIDHIKRVSTPGCRIYSSVRDLRLVNGGFGIQVLSTSNGIMSDSEAREKNVGGEVLFEVF